MSDQEPNLDPKKTLSEISHLFLSSIRDKQTNGAPRPQRKAPGPLKPEGTFELPERAKPEPAEASDANAAKPQAAPRTDVSIDLTPEEFAQVYGGADAASPPAGAQRPQSAEQEPRKYAPVSALIASHLNGKQFDRVKEYARHLATQFGRVGLIEVDASEFRLMCFEAGATPGDLADAAAANARQPECYDARQISEAIEELGCDVARWIVLLTTPRVPEARALLRQVDHWVLLTTADHDGVVSAYRSLKGLAEPGHPPRLSLALLDDPAEPVAVSVYGKLAGVCQQFLGLRLDAESSVRRSFRVAEHLVMLCRPNRDKAQVANPPQWGIVAGFLSAARAAARSAAKPAEQPAASEIQVTEQEEVVETLEMPQVESETVEQSMREVERQVQSAIPTPTGTPVAPAPQPAAAPAGPAGGYEEVVELADGGASAEAILSAILRQNNGSYVECPVRAPMCGEVRLAIGRDRGIVLFAVAREGLGELRSIGQALRWASENRGLLGMALPQFAIDTNQTPRLRLLVDQSDLSADLLQPVLQSEHVTVQSYRKLRWGGRTGLLLDAA